MDRATAYARSVVDGTHLAGHSEYLACKRHLDNMADPDFPYYFDIEESERAISMANELTILEGVEIKKLETRGFQEFIIGSIHGWKSKRTGFNRFREAYVQMARQNGKSFIAGTEINYWATFSGYREGKIYCAATKQDQANIVWDEARKFIQADKDLDSIYTIRNHEHTITSKVTNTVVKAIGRDTKSADGFRSILAVIDEYHAHPTNQMYKLMNDGQIRVDTALTLAITTAGFNINGPCHSHYEFCKRVLAGAIHKESLFIYIAEMDEGDDIWDPNNWAKANPLNMFNPDGSINEIMRERMIEKSIDAREMGGEELLNFMTKTLNVWVTAGPGNFVKLEKFAECESNLTIADMAGKQAYLGVDLSSGGDLTSIALTFPLPSEKYYVYSHSFMPEKRLEEHEKLSDLPYRMWVRSGHLTLTSGLYGLKTDYKAIIKHLEKLINELEIELVMCGYDSHNASAFLADLEALVDCVEVKQSARALNEATQDFALSVETLQVMYDRENELFRQSVASAKLVYNSFGECKIDKASYKDKIDPCDAVIDAWVVMKADEGNCPTDVNEAFDTFMSHFYGGG